MRRVRGLNYMANLAHFLKTWDTPVPASDVVHLDFKTGPQGQKNLTGAEDAPAPAFGRHHPQFEASIEAGVKPLVLFLVSDLNCITYSSCAGHPGGDRFGIRQVRHVGIIPRDRREGRRLRDAFAAAIPRVNATDADVTVRMEPSVLDSDGFHVPCLDLDFLPRPGRESGYFGALDDVCDRLIQELRHSVHGCI